MAKPISLETFGEAGIGQLQSPLSFQLNGHGTPEHPCDMIPAGDKTPDLYPIPDPLNLCKCKGKGK